MMPSVCLQNSWYVAYTAYALFLGWCRTPGSDLYWFSLVTAFHYKDVWDDQLLLQSREWSVLHVVVYMFMYIIIYMYYSNYYSSV